MRNSNRDLMSMAIPMEIFLRDFVFANGYGKAVNTTTGEVLDLRLIENVNHYDIDELAFEGVKRASWDEVTNESVMKGQILLVRSSSWKKKGSMIIPYYRPQLVLGDGFAAAMKKDFNENIESAPLPTSYTLRRMKRSGRKRF